MTTLADLKNIPEPTLQQINEAYAHETSTTLGFGGKIDPEEGKGFEQAISKYLSKSGGGVTLSEIERDAADAFKSQAVANGLDENSANVLKKEFQKDNYATDGKTSPFKIDLIIQALNKTTGTGYLNYFNAQFLGSFYEWAAKYAKPGANSSNAWKPPPDTNNDGQQNDQLEEAELNKLKDQLNNVKNGAGPPSDRGQVNPQGEKRENPTADYVNALQCALMSQLEQLARYKRTQTKKTTGSDKEGWKEEYAYGGRILNMEEDQPENCLNKLLLSKTVGMKGWIHNAFFDYITPYFELYVVDEKGVERYFPLQLGVGAANVLQHSEVSEATEKDLGNNLKDTLFYMKGASVKYEGGTPATARSDVQVEMTWAFKGLGILEYEFDVFGTRFAEGTRYREVVFLRNQDRGVVTHKVKPIDLISIPQGVGDASGAGKGFRRQYNPNYSRVRIKYGSYLDIDAMGRRLVGELKRLTGLTEEAMIEYAKSSNHLDLAIVDHNLSLKEEGQADEWEMTLSYRGFTQQLLTSPMFNALQTQEDLKEITKREDDIYKLAEEKNCSAAQTRTLLRQLNGDIANRTKATYGNLITNLIEQDLILSVDVKNEVLDKILIGEFDFEQREAFAPQDVKPEGDVDPNAANSHKLSEEERKKKSENKIKETQKKAGSTHVPFVFLGDILRVATDSIYVKKSGNKDGLIDEIQPDDFRFITCPFTYKNQSKENSRPVSINISEIPMSIDFFQSWFHENVVKKKRQHYAIGAFIRDLCEVAMSNLLSEFCYGDSLEPKIHFKTSFFRTKSAATKKTSYYPKLRLKPALDNNSGNTSYFVIHPVNQNIWSSGNDGSMRSFKNNFVPYLPFGITCLRGPVNKIDFSKQDAPYLREARFFNSSQSGLTLLSNVYDATLDLDAVFDYYPGSLVYIDPWDLTKSTRGVNGKKTECFEEGSFAYMLGLGGYHIITKSGIEFTDVQSGLNASVNVTAKWAYSGTPSEERRVSNKKKKPKDSPNKGSTACEQEIKIGRGKVVSQIGSSDANSGATETPPEGGVPTQPPTPPT
jgi:glutaredoxin